MSISQILSSSSAGSCLQCKTPVEKKDKAALRCSHLFHQQCLNAPDERRGCPRCAKKVDVTEYTLDRVIVSIAFLAFAYSFFPSPFST